MKPGDTHESTENRSDSAFYSFSCHDCAGIRHFHDLLHGCRIKRKRHGIAVNIHQLFKFRHAADSADEFNPVIRTRIQDAQYGRQQMILQNSGIKAGHRIFRVVNAIFNRQAIP